MTKKKSKRGERLRPRVSRTRNAALDALRGFAILLMIVDHIAFFLLDVPITPTTLRIATRFSMPLFCGLMGYFLASKVKINWNRFYQLWLAAALVNLAFFSAYHKLEILASLLVCYVLFQFFRSWLCLAVAAVYLTPFDPSVSWFDYSLPIAVSCVAQGMVTRLADWRIATLTGLLVTLGVWVVAPPAAYVLYYVLPSTWLIAWAARNPEFQWDQLKLGWLEFIGRYPLTVYVTQYYVIFALSRKI